MSREIKFRGFNTKTKQMLLSTDAPGTDYERLALFFGGMSLGFELRQPHEELHLMQYTGLKDKKGVEIYEGDILKVCNGSLNGYPWMNKPYEVKYKLNKGFIMCMFCWDENGNSIMNSTHWCEVIGNIYENSELLEHA
jgi:uncharacterized phage protein (TIGR01671 family)